MVIVAPQTAPKLWAGTRADSAVMKNKFQVHIRFHTQDREKPEVIYSKKAREKENIIFLHIKKAQNRMIIFLVRAENRRNLR